VSSNAVVIAFQNPLLNQIGGELIENYKTFHGHQSEAKQLLKKAIVRRFLSGKIISTHIDQILEECGSQRAFGEKIGITDAMLSNDKRAYEALASRGVETPEDMLAHLEEKQIKANIYEWERLPKFLEQPDLYRDPDRRARDEKRLEELEQETAQIRQRNESAFNNNIAKLASDSLKQIEETKQHLKKMDPFAYKWTNRKYINWAKGLGWDFINDEPAENLEFHHTDMHGASGVSGAKLPDVFGLPTSIRTHQLIEEGKYQPKPIQIASGLIKLMSLFIMNHYDKH
jgi:hypothetical protein